MPARRGRRPRDIHGVAKRQNLEWRRNVSASFISRNGIVQSVDLTLAQDPSGLLSTIWRLRQAPIGVNGDSYSCAF